jgi:hypothetical protein
MSAHRNISCNECHGTALSNGFHSLSEKAGMVWTHFREEQVDGLRMTEGQVLESMKSCIRCHQDAWSDWLAGGHSATYQAIFLNAKQNSGEQLNFDCLRCHGMFFAGSVEDLIRPIDTRGPWQMKDTLMKDQPVMPCMACHQMHSSGLPAIRPDYALPTLMEYNRPPWISSLAEYSRPEKMYFHVSVLPKPEIYNQGKPVRVSDDTRQKLCMQCHAPQANHQSGTADDRTPRGVHEGLSCLSCHKPHNNETRSSCQLCHPALSNCGLDVEKMNTTFADPKSPNNIHFVSCTDCHANN